MKMASLVLGTAADQYGCFVPDLTRFTTFTCEGARRLRIIYEFEFCASKENETEIESLFHDSEW